jgi:hypothetical protein
MLEAEGTGHTISLPGPPQRQKTVNITLTRKWKRENCKYNETENQTVLTIPTELGKTVKAKVSRL